MGLRDASVSKKRVEADGVAHKSTEGAQDCG